MGSAQAEHVLRHGEGRIVRLRTAKRTEEVEGGDRRAEGENLDKYNRKEKTHETVVALLAEVTDVGGRLSAGPEEVE